MQKIFIIDFNEKMLFMYMTIKKKEKYFRNKNY